MPTPADLARIDARLIRFFKHWGSLIDRTLVAIGICVLAWFIGYLMGLGVE